MGVSNWAAWQVMKVRGIPEREGLSRFESLQAYYTVACRDFEREVLPMLKEEETGLLVRSPLAGGAPERKVRSRTRGSGGKPEEDLRLPAGGSVPGL